MKKFLVLTISILLLSACSNFPVLENKDTHNVTSRNVNNDIVDVSEDNISDDSKNESEVTEIEKSDKVAEWVPKDYIPKTPKNKNKKQENYSQSTTHSLNIQNNVRESTLSDEEVASYLSEIGTAFGLEVYNPYGGSLESYAAYLEEVINDSDYPYQGYFETDDGSLIHNPIYNNPNDPGE